MTRPTLNDEIGYMRDRPHGSAARIGRREIGPRN
jgi:hypothetical protein